MVGSACFYHLYQCLIIQLDMEHGRLLHIVRQLQSKLTHYSPKNELQVAGMKLTFNSSAPANSHLLDAWFYEGTLIEGYSVPIAVLTLSTLGAPSQNLGDR